MDLSTVFFAGLILCLHLAQTAYALQCFSCAPMSARGEDCARTRADQMQLCSRNHDICLVTAVTLPGESIPVITRQCAASREHFDARFIHELPPYGAKSNTFTEGERVTKQYACNFNGCNRRNMLPPATTPSITTTIATTTTTTTVAPATTVKPAPATTAAAAAVASSAVPLIPVAAANIFIIISALLCMVYV